MSDGYIADTSVFVAAEERRPVGTPPEGDARISVATLTEVIETLARSRSFVALPYDEPVAERLGGLLATVRAAGRRAGAMDAIIAATPALAHDLVVWTQDADFDVLAALAPSLRIHQG